MKPARLLLAVDLRPTSAAAIRWAARRALDPGILVEVVSVATDDDELLGDARAAVGAAREEILRQAPAARVTTAVPRGNVVDVLVESSASADLLVIGSDRPRPLRALLHAALPMRLTGRVTCDLVVVPSTWDGSAGGAVAVGWDDDGSSLAAIDAAAAEAEAAGVPLQIHHVWRPVAVSGYDPSGGAALISAIEEDERRALARVVRETSARFPRVPISGELHLGAGGGGILRHAAAASLIVVGSHRRSMIGEIVAGTTSDDLIAASDRIPVLVTPPGDPD